MPDEFLSIDEVAQRLLLPADMIRRRIESGDIPVHWVEVEGRLEMRVSFDDMGGLTASAPAFPDPFSPSGAEDLQPVAEEQPTEDWATAGSDYPQGLWTPVETSGTEQTNPWEVSPTSDLAAAELGSGSVPVWRPDPATWEDEPLQSAPAAPAEPPAESPAELSPAAEAEFEDASEQPAPAFGDPGTDEELDSPFLGTPRDDEQAATTAYPYPEPTETYRQGSFEAGLYQPETPASSELTAAEQALPLEASAEADLGFQEMDYSDGLHEVEESPSEPAEEEVARPSALAAAQLATAGSTAVNSIDARELVAGLFDRWERALEQRIQAEQRLRFEAELEQRLRQVRDLRQELDQTRQAQAAQAAEREQEVMELRNKVRELEQGNKGFRLFRR